MPSQNIPPHNPAPENGIPNTTVPTNEEIQDLAREFESCLKILTALGDENRQHLILEMMKIEQCYGARVGTITEKTHLSRPAVSHHLQILKDAGLLKVRREGTKNYYYFDAETEAMNRLLQMLSHAKQIMERLPDRSENRGESRNEHKSENKDEPSNEKGGV